jgi:hypothetical protein
MRIGSAIGVEDLLAEHGERKAREPTALFVFVDEPV